MNILLNNRMQFFPVALLNALSEFLFILFASCACRSDCCCRGGSVSAKEVAFAVISHEPPVYGAGLVRLKVDPVAQASAL